MKVIVTENYEESCAYAAGIICSLVKEKPDCKLGLATGSTPLPIYRKLIEANNRGEITFKQVHTVNLDEYCDLDGTNKESYRYFMDHNLFDGIDIDKKNTYVPKGTGDHDKNIAGLETKISEGGCIDLQLLGIGNNGHIGFNEASDTLHTGAHIEKLTQSTIDANSRFFERKEDVPVKAITMGIGNILSAKRIVLVASGPSKAEAVKGLICDDTITTRNPSTMIKLHKNATVIIDKALADAAGYTGYNLFCYDK